MNGNGSAHHPEKEDFPKENIFLFWPNLIGWSYLQTLLEIRSNIKQAMQELSSRSLPYTTCHSIRGLAQASTASPVSSMLSMDMPLDISSNRLGLVLS
jgi:hypothetical protein